jgi:Ca2+-binding RTX toxin-like protein
MAQISTYLNPGMGSGNPYADSPSALVYTITGAPTHGQLTVNGSTVGVGGTFTQQQIDDGQLQYTESGQVYSTDCCSFSISDIFVHNNYGSGSFNIAIAGTDGGRTFVGSSVANVFFSGAGNNWIIGGSGTTLSYINAPSPVNVNLALGSASNGFGGVDTLTGVHTVIGSAYGDTLTGSSVHDLLDGGPGNDLLRGGAGSDAFAFDSTLNSKLNRDHIADFRHGVDKILIDHSFFPKIPIAAHLNTAYFLTTPPAASNHHPYIIYSKVNGVLTYDSNGGAPGGAVQFAVLDNHPTLTASDFVVVA